MRPDGLDESSSDKELAAEAAWMLEHAATTIAFAHRQILMAAGGEIDPRRPTHANSVWDERVCALIDQRARLSPQSLFHGAPLIVVTSETQILTAATVAGHRSRVRSLGEHCETIGLRDLAITKGWLRTTA